MDVDAGPTARQLMRRHMVTLEADEPLGVAHAALRMGRLRGVPVLHAGRLVGELRLADVASLARRGLVDGDDAVGPGPLGALPVRAAMRSPRPGVAPETPAGELARRLVDDAAGYLPVVAGEGRLLGIVTESDLLATTLRARGFGGAEERPQS